MTDKDSQKIGVILLAMGGPDSLDDIPEYLHNIFSDRDLIRLPGGRLGQKLLARIISRARSKKVQGHYALIGGSSPLLKWTDAQARLIEKQMSSTIPGLRCYVGMRYFRPYTETVIAQAVQDGCTHLILLPMYPQYSKATTGSCIDAARRALANHPGVSYTLIDDYHDDEHYIALLQDYIKSHSDPDDILLFSAHSLPQKFVDDGDPYVDQIKRSAKLAAGDRDYVVSFQSRTGPVKWVGPDTVDETKRLITGQNRPLFVIPIAFVCDHIETLYEIDIELPEKVGGIPDGRLKRMPMFNDDPRFAECLAHLIQTRLSDHVKV